MYLCNWINNFKFWNKHAAPLLRYQSLFLITTAVKYYRLHKHFSTQNSNSETISIYIIKVKGKSSVQTIMKLLQGGINVHCTDSQPQHKTQMSAELHAPHKSASYYSVTSKWPNKDNRKNYFLLPFFLLFLSSRPLLPPTAFPFFVDPIKNSSPSYSHFLHHVKTVPSWLFLRSFIPHALLTFSLFSPIFFPRSFYLSVLL